MASRQPFTCQISNRHFKPDPVPKSTLIVGPGFDPFHGNISMEKLAQVNRTGSDKRITCTVGLQKRVEFGATYLELQEAVLIQ